MGNAELVKKIAKKNKSRKFIEGYIGKDGMDEIKRQKADDAKENRKFRNSSHYVI